MSDAKASIVNIQTHTNFNALQEIIIVYSNSKVNIV